MRGDWSPPVKSVSDKFWCSPIVCWAFGWWGLVSVHIFLRFWCGRCGCSMVGLDSLGFLLGLLSLCVGGFTQHACGD